MIVFCWEPVHGKSSQQTNFAVNSPGAHDWPPSRTQPVLIHVLLNELMYMGQNRRLEAPRITHGGLMAGPLTGGLEAAQVRPSPSPNSQPIILSQNKFLKKFDQITLNKNKTI